MWWDGLRWVGLEWVVVGMMFLLIDVVEDEGGH